MLGDWLAFFAVLTWSYGFQSDVRHSVLNMVLRTLAMAMGSAAVAYLRRRIALERLLSASQWISALLVLGILVAIGSSSAISLELVSGLSFLEAFFANVFLVSRDTYSTIATNHGTAADLGKHRTPQAMLERAYGMGQILGPLLFILIWLSSRNYAIELCLVLDAFTFISAWFLLKNLPPTQSRANLPLFKLTDAWLKIRLDLVISRIFFIRAIWFILPVWFANFLIFPFAVKWFDGVVFYSALIYSFVGAGRFIVNQWLIRSPKLTEANIGMEWAFFFKASVLLPVAMVAMAFSPKILGLLFAAAFGALNGGQITSSRAIVRLLAAPKMDISEYYAIEGIVGQLVNLGLCLIFFRFPGIGFGVGFVVVASLVLISWIGKSREKLKSKAVFRPLG